MTEPGAGAETYLEASFDSGSDGFTYSNDTFNNTNIPLKAAGSHVLWKKNKYPGRGNGMLSQYAGVFFPYL